MTQNNLLADYFKNNQTQINRILQSINTPFIEEELSDKVGELEKEVKIMQSEIDVNAEGVIDYLAKEGSLYTPYWFFLTSYIKEDNMLLINRKIQDVYGDAANFFKKLSIDVTKTVIEGLTGTDNRIGAIMGEKGHKEKLLQRQKKQNRFVRLLKKIKSYLG